MGSKSGTESIVAILKAFMDRKTWSQAELAVEVGLKVPALRRCLGELQSSGVPFEIDSDHPHVYWSLPKSWFPGGVLFLDEQVTELFRLALHLPKSKARDDLVEKLLQFLPRKEATRAAMNAIVPMEISEREEKELPIIERALEEHVTLSFRYLTAGSGLERRRSASVHHLDLRTHPRFLATCHTTGKLKMFRVDGASESRLEPGEAFREEDAKLIDAHVRARIDGFHDGGEVKRHEFFVQNPDARWVQRSLPPEMRWEPAINGIRVTVQTAAVSQVARFVVGLGAAGKALSDDLAQHVRSLAEGALSPMT